MSADHTYTVQFSDTAVGGPWSKLGDIVSRSTDRVETLTDRFYRVVPPRQP